MEFKLMTPNDVTRSRPQALRQGNGGGRRRDAAQVALLRRVLRVRSLAKQFGLPLCDRAHLKAMTDGELHAYFYNLDDRIKRYVMSRMLRSPSGGRFPMRWKPGNSSNGSLSFEPIVKSATPSELGFE
jgi:hypothetical protein